MMILSLCTISTGSSRGEKISCDEVLESCAKTVESQKVTIDKQQEAIDAKDGVINEQDKQIEELEEDVSSSSTWNTVLTILTVILLL